MSVVSANVIGTKASAVNVAGAGRSYTVTYRVVTDDIDDQGLTAMTAVGIPSINEYYQVGNDVDLGAFPRSYSATLQTDQDDRKVWNVTVVFTGAAGGAAVGGMNAAMVTGDQLVDPTSQFIGGGLKVESPWLIPARITGYSENKEKKWAFARHYTDPSDPSTEEILENSADNPADSSVIPSIFWSYMSLVIEKDFEDFDDRWLEYANCVNSREFFREPRGHWLMQQPTISRKYTGDGTEYFNVVFEFQYSNDGAADIDTGISEGWNGLPVLDKGLVDVDGNAKATVAGIPIMELGDLNGVDGDWSTDGAHFFPADGWNPFQEKDFGLLDIPQDWT